MSKLLGKRIELKKLRDTTSSVALVSNTEFEVLDTGHTYTGILKKGDKVKLESPERISPKKGSDTYIVIEEQIERIL